MQSFTGDVVAIIIIAIPIGLASLALGGVVKRHSIIWKVALGMGIPLYISGLCLASRLGGYAAIMILVGLVMSVMGGIWCLSKGDNHAEKV